MTAYDIELWLKARGMDHSPEMVAELLRWSQEPD